MHRPIFSLTADWRWEDDERPLVLLMDQIEFADIIVLNKIDIAAREQVETARGIIRVLNAEARVVEITQERSDENSRGGGSGPRNSAINSTATYSTLSVWSAT